MIPKQKLCLPHLLCVCEIVSNCETTIQRTARQIFSNNSGVHVVFSLPLANQNYFRTSKHTNEVTAKAFRICVVLQ